MSLKLWSSLGVVVLVLLQVSSVWSESQNWPLDLSDNYTYHRSLISMSEGAATLVDQLGGSGADGSLIIEETIFNISENASNGRDFPDGISWSVTSPLSAGNEFFNIDEYSGGLAVGDEILIIDMRGTIEDNDGVGNWELKQVLEISETQITVKSLEHHYDGVNHVVMVQRVPNYTDVSLTNSILTANGFNGETGGIVAFRANGAVSIDSDSSILASGLGYAGGAGGAGDGSGGTGGETFVGVDGNGGSDGATNGVGAGGGGEGPRSNVGTKGGDGGYGAGGGGGDGTDNSDDGAGAGGGGGHAGGGGGGGGGTGGGMTAGRGGVGGSVGVAAGGGGGSSVPGGAGGDAGSDGVISSSCYDQSARAGHVGSGQLSGGGGDTCGSHYGGGGGGGGGFYGDPDLNFLFLGGGGAGGGGSAHGVQGGNGGNGGGIILLFARQLDLSGSINADGARGIAATTAHRSASGGGGAGGSIYLKTQIFTSSGAVSCEGGPAIQDGVTNAIAGSGGGGDGYIRVDVNLANGASGEDAAALIYDITTPDAGAIYEVSPSFATLGEICSNEPLTLTGEYDQWSGFTSEESPEGGEITFIIRDNEGNNWWFDGNNWANSSNSSESNSAIELSRTIGSLPLTEISWCAYLTGDGTQEVGLLDVAIRWMTDTDSDGISDGLDNCPSVFNEGQSDGDGDNIGDACDGCTDLDEDGFGSTDYVNSDCEEDCDDTDSEIHPGAQEIWYDGIDRNCDGLDDFDADEDGYDDSEEQHLNNFDISSLIKT